MYPGTFKTHASRSLAISAAVLLVACGDAKQAITAPTDGALGGPALARPAPSTPLAVTVEDAGFRITSDAGGEYLDGSQGVAASIDGNGNLIFQTGTTRTLNFDFSHQTGGTPYLVDLTGKNPGVSVLTLQNGINGGLEPKITSLAVGGSAFYPTSFAFGTAANGIRVLFHRDAENTLATQSTYAYITRTGAGTWTMVSSSTCPGSPDVAGVWTNDLATKRIDLVFRGYYSMPFSIHLRAL